MIAVSAFGKPLLAASLLDISGATAVERWNLSAKAARGSWDAWSAQDPVPPATHFVTRFASSDIHDIEARRASLAFDWQRRAGADRLSMSAFATHQGVDGRSAAEAPAQAAFGERLGQRERRSLLGADASWSTNHSIGTMAGASKAGVRLRSESLDAEGLLEDASRGLSETLHHDRLRQGSVGFHFEHELQVARGVRAAAGVRLDRYRFGVSSDAAGAPGSAAGTAFAPHFSLAARPAHDLELVAGYARGLRSNDARTPGAALDPRTGAPLGVLDPSVSSGTIEAGLRTRIFGVETKLSAWRASADAELTLLDGGGVAWTARATRRDAVQATLRYQPAAWLSLDLDAALVRARFADGAGEAIPGAARSYGQAGATVRPGRGWNASLFVTSFGPRAATDDDLLRGRAASFVSGRITRQLTKATRVSLDLFNLFDKRIGTVDHFSATRLWSYPGAADNFLFYPGEARGLRLRLRTTF
jgi:TonB-dependent receptor-like protein